MPLITEVEANTVVFKINKELDRLGGSSVLPKDIQQLTGHSQRSAVVTIKNSHQLALPVPPILDQNSVYPPHAHHSNFSLARSPRTTQLHILARPAHIRFIYIQYFGNLFYTNDEFSHCRLVWGTPSHGGQ